MIRRFFEKRSSSHQLLTAEEFHEPIAAFMDDELVERGFVHPKQGVWTTEYCLSGRPIFELRHYKGAVSAVVWGFSLIYVPHFNNACTKLYWHRTVKSARIDVFPFDEAEKTQGLSRFAAPASHAITVESVLRSVIDQGLEFFDRHRSVDDLLPLFERLRRYRGDGPGYWNYSNLPLAHAFTLRVLGHESRAIPILEKFAQRMELSDPVQADLMERVGQATADPVLF